MHHPPITTPDTDHERAQLARIELDKAIDHLTEAYDLAPDGSQLEALLRILRKTAKHVLNPEAA